MTKSISLHVTEEWDDVVVIVVGVDGGGWWFLCCSLLCGSCYYCRCKCVDNPFNRNIAFQAQVSTT